MDKTKKIPNKYKILFVILFIYIICMIMYMMFYKEETPITLDYVYLNSESILRYDKQKKEWTDQFLLSDINGDIFDVYTKEDKKTPYKLYFQEKNIYYYSLNDKPIKMMDDNWFAITKDDDVKVQYINFFHNQEIDDIIEDVLFSNDLDSSMVDIIYQFSCDIDSDGETESFYSISNAFSDDDTLYSMIFMLDNQTITYLKQEIVDNQISEEVEMMTSTIPQTYISNVITINDINYLFVQKDYKGRSKPEYEIYVYQNNEFKLVKNIKE